MLNHINSKYFKLAVGELKKDTPTEIVSCCPLCGDTKNRLHLYSTEVGDLVHCFNDGCTLSDKHHSMKNFLDIIGSSYLGSYKRETLGHQVDKIKTETSLQDILKKITTPVKKPKKPKDIPLQKTFLKASEVPECVEYLETRNIKVHEDWFFSKDKFFEFNKQKVFLKDYLLIPIYNEDYKYRGFYSRSIKEKQFSTFLLEGTEKVWRKYPDKFPDIICEGIFDALSTGFDNCAAMIGASVSETYRNELPKSTIFAFDGDKTGVKKALLYVTEGFKIFVWPDDIKEKDFNDMLVSGYKTSDIKKMIQENTYQGIIAKTRLLMKER